MAFQSIFYIQWKFVQGFHQVAQKSRNSVQRDSIKESLQETSSNWWRIVIFCLDCAYSSILISHVGFSVAHVYFDKELGRPRKTNDMEM